VFHERLRTALVVAAFIASAAFFAYLPGSLPGAYGVPPEAAVWIGRAISAFLLPLVALVVCTLFRRLAAADPDRANYARFRPTFNLALNAGVAFILGLHAILLATLVLGPRSWLGYLPSLLFGVLVAMVGNALPRVRPNVVVGINTPWARRSERTWALTHRVGGYVIVGFGLVIMASTAILRPWLGWIVGAGTGATVLLLAVVSWLAWRMEHST
jgi:uncharacterized membrane protein